MIPGGAKVGAFALILAAVLIWVLPSASQAGGSGLSSLDVTLQQTTQQLGHALQESLDRTERLLRETLSGKPAGGRQATPNVVSPEPTTQPPLHGTNPHGQGSVLALDLLPSSERPLGGNPNGSNAGPEEIVIGRARGEKNGDTFHGHITILALLGSDVLAVDTNEGETASGPLQAVQDAVLDPVCVGTGVCLGVLTANSTTTSTGSTNNFALATANITGLGVGAAQSNGTIAETATCQTATGGANTANVANALGSVAAVANSSTVSQSCQNQAPQTVNTSTVIGLGGVAVPLPAAGCADGTPDTVTGLPPLLPIICHATDVLGAAAVREALDVFLLDVGDTALLRESTAATEAITVAPAGPEDGGPECSDGADNDGDGVIDADDPGCHSDGDPDNPDSYNPNDDDETDGGGDGNGGPGTPECSDNIDNDGDGVSDENDPGCHGDGNPNNPGSYNPNDDDETNGGGRGAPECSDGVDNDGDGVSDARDPGCHTDGNPNNPNSYNPNDDDESNGPRTVAAGTLPFTGTDITGLALAGLLLLGGGLLMRRREGVRGR